MHSFFFWAVVFCVCCSAARGGASSGTEAVDGQRAKDAAPADKGVSPSSVKTGPPAPPSSEGGDLWSAIFAGQPTGNICFSPVLVTQGLAILMQGASGDTKDLLKASLVGEGDAEKFYETVKVTFESMDGAGRLDVSRILGAAVEEVDGSVRVTSIEDAAIADVIGLRVGDILTSINGEPVAAVSKNSSKISDVSSVVIDRRLGMKADEDSSRRASASLTAATSVWIRPEVVVREAFLKSLEDRFKATINKADRVSLEKDVQSWFQINGSKQKVALSNDDKDAELLLLSICKFSGQWREPFSDAGRSAFTLEGGQKAEVGMIKALPRTKVRVWEADGSVAVEFPYKGSRYSAILILPKAGLPREERILAAKALTRSIDTAERASVSVTVPRFSFASEVDLRQHLMSLGLSRIFSSNAEFFGVSDKGLRVGRWRQFVSIHFDEFGTIADAAQAVQVIPLGARDRRIVFDRAFFVAVLDLRTKQIVFWSYVANPTP